MYANLSVKPDGFEAIAAREVWIKPNGTVVVIEDPTPEGPGVEEVECPVHELRVEELPEGGMTIKADF